MTKTKLRKAPASKKRAKVRAGAAMIMAPEVAKPSESQPLLLMPPKESQPTETKTLILAEPKEAAAKPKKERGYFEGARHITRRVGAAVANYTPAFVGNAAAALKKRVTDVLFERSETEVAASLASDRAAFSKKVTAEELAARGEFKTQTWTQFRNSGLSFTSMRDRIECLDVDRSECAQEGTGTMRCFNYDKKKQTKSTCRPVAKLQGFQEKRRVKRNRLLTAAVAVPLALGPGSAATLIFANGALPRAVTHQLASNVVLGVIGTAAPIAVGLEGRDTTGAVTTNVKWDEYFALAPKDHGAAVCTLRTSNYERQTCAKGTLALTCSSFGPNLRSVSPCMAKTPLFAARKRIESELRATLE